jgi:hypothetical protein
MLAVTCGPVAAQGVYSTTVTPRVDDDILAPCQYELTIPQTGVATRAVWVIFDRGREVADLYNSPGVFRFAGKERLALLLARHCRAKDREDMNVDPAKGIGHALFQALDQLANESHHSELASSKVIVFGFSGAASLAARLPGYAPDRVLASIAYAPGQYEPLGMDTVDLPPAAAAIPQLIIANGADTVNGTKQPVKFFRKYFDKGSPWVLAIQNGVPHHGGLANTKPLMFAWIETILNATPGSTGITALAAGQRGGWWLYLRTARTARRDNWKNPVDRVTNARIEKAGAAAPRGYIGAGSMPSRKAANEWLAFVKQRQHKVNTKYP